MEVKVTESNGTNVVDASDTRTNPTYIFYYTLSLIWHPTLTTGKIYFSLLMENLLSSELYFLSF